MRGRAAGSSHPEGSPHALPLVDGAGQLLEAFLSGEVSSNTGGLIMWPAWVLIPLGFGLLGVLGISELIKRIAILRGDIPDPVHEHDAEAAHH